MKSVVVLRGAILPLVMVLACCPAFGATRTLNLSTNGTGHITRNPTNAVYPGGAVVTLTATPVPGWMFTSWGGDLAGSVNPTNVTMDADKAITGNFSPLPNYELRVSVTGQGSVNPAGGMYLSNTVVALTATPSNGWIFLNWTGDAGGIANPLNLNMNTNKAVTALFVQPSVIAAQPQSVELGAGATASFSVGANGTAPLAYLWRFNSNAIAGATVTNLIITNVQPVNAGDYSVVVSNAYGSATSQVATLTVTNVCFGSNVLTVCDEAHLRQAVAQGGTVRFCVNGILTLTNTIEITNNVTFDASDHYVVINGGNAVRLFSVRTNVAFALTNLTLANGWHIGMNGANEDAGQTAKPGEDAAGGAIHNNGGTVSLVACVLSNNSAVGGNSGTTSRFGQVGANAGDGRGGALFNRGGTVIMESVLVVSNSATGGGVSGGDYASGTNGAGLGGALWSVGGAVSIKSSVFWGNVSVGRARGYSNQTPSPARGGAVGTESASVSIVASTFVANAAIGEGPVYPGQVRPAAAYGGGLCIQSGTAIVSRCEFLTNSALGGNANRYSGTGEAQGGGICNFGSLRLTDSRISNNRAVAGNYSSVNASGEGGGLYNGGNASLTASTFDYNLARGGDAGSFGSAGAAFPGGLGYGGAVFNSGMLSGTNCTLALNQVFAGSASGSEPLASGGIAHGGAIHNAGGTVSLMAVTVASNSVVQGIRSPPSRGANIANAAGTLSLVNSIVAFGVGSSNAWGTITDGGFNMSTDGSCNFASGASFNFTDPKLGPLGDNGGPTLTMYPQPESPAIDFGTIAGTPTMDQRGYARPFGDGADIGAVEVGRLTPALFANRDGSYFRVSFTPDVGGTYELLRSTNLVAWEMHGVVGPLATNESVEWLIPLTAQPGYFKLRSQ